MKTLALSLCALAVCGAYAGAQITMFPPQPAGSPPPAALVSPVIMDFDTVGSVPPPPPGGVGNQDPYFVSFGICQVAIVNAPGMHTAGSDTLSSGFMGNCVASVNNQLSIVAPGGAMDDHTAGAGFRFVLAPGTIATQFGCLIVDQINHQMAVETWFGGILQNTFTFTVANPTGGFPNEHIYFEDLAGFDEVRFMNTGTAGGWGVDEFTLANVIGTPGPCTALPPPPYQPNSAEASLTVSGAPDPGVFGSIVVASGLNAPQTLDLASINAFPHDIGIDFGGMTVPLGVITPGNQVVNIDVTSPGFTFLYGGTASLILTNNFPTPSYQIPFSVSAPFVAAAQMVIADPIQPDGVILSHAADYSATACSLAVNFDSLAANNGGTASGGPYPIGWADGGGTAQWQVRTGTTTSGATGPIAGAFSPPNYMYCETSVPNSPGGTFFLDTCLYDLTQLSTFDLTFRLSRIGATIGTLNVLIDDGTGTYATQVATYTGAEPTGTDWTLETISLIPFLPATNVVSIRFEYTAGASFTGDIAIDDFQLQ